MEPALAGRLAQLAGAGPGQRPHLLADRPDALVVRSGPVVVKAHSAASDLVSLRQRVRLAARPELRRALLTPLPCPGPGPDGLVGLLPGGRPVTRWPYGAPVDPERPDRAPWAEAGELLAALHRAPVGMFAPGTPRMRGPRKAARALRRMRRSDAPRSATSPVEAAWRGLPVWARGESAPVPREGRDDRTASRPLALCHGDFHLGQLVRHPAAGGRWRLIDVDDLGLGDPAWDLGRPAAWFAAGLLPAEDWERLLGAYRAAGGCAVPATGDPWPALDVPARALTVQGAATAAAKASEEGRAPDESEQALLDGCLRIVQLCAGRGT